MLSRSFCMSLGLSGYGLYAQLRVRFTLKDNVNPCLKLGETELARNR